MVRLRFPSLLGSPTGPGQPYPAEVAAVRALIEQAGLSRREAAARAGLREDTVGRWARRFGWRRADVGGAGPSPSPLRGGPSRSEAEVRGGGRAEGIAEGFSGPTPTQARPAAESVPPRKGEERGRPYGPEMHEAARARIEGTRVGLERIGLELGVSRWTLVRWQRQFGWQRPAPLAKMGRYGTVGPDFFRSRRLGRPYAGDAVGTARDLVTGSRLPLDRVAARAGISRATLYRWIARRGWTRLAVGQTRRRRYRPPYGPEVVAAARELYQTTELPTANIAARVKTTRERVVHWARQQGWGRPRDLPDPHGRLRRRRTRRR